MGTVYGWRLDIYSSCRDGKYPVLLCRTPYNKNGQADFAKFLVQNGYAVVVMDSRGLYASYGDWHQYLTKGRDGYDTQQGGIATVVQRQSWNVRTFVSDSRSCYRPCTAART
jgi:hypothetical protein